MIDEGQSDFCLGVADDFAVGLVSKDLESSCDDLSRCSPLESVGLVGLTESTEAEMGLFRSFKVELAKLDE